MKYDQGNKAFEQYEESRGNTGRLQLTIKGGKMYTSTKEYTMDIYQLTITCISPVSIKALGMNDRLRPTDQFETAVN